jgi:hypothetical protein
LSFLEVDGLSAVVGRHTGTGVLGVMDGIGDELPDVVVGEAVEDLDALLAGEYQPCEPQLGQVLGDGALRFAECVGELVDRPFVIEQYPEDPHPAWVGEHAEHLDR